MLPIKTQLLADFSSKVSSKAIFVLLCMLLLALSFMLWTDYESTKEKLIISIADTFKQRAAALENELNSIIHHVEILQNISNTQLKTKTSAQLENIYKNDILNKKTMYSDAHYYALEQGITIGGDKVQGNIFWVENKEKTANKMLMRLAVNLFPVQAAEQKNNKHIMLSYFISETAQFISIYPAVDHKRIIKESGNNAAAWFAHAYEVYTPFEAFTINPDRKHFWTKPYLDRAGNGMMVSCAIPIDNNNVVLGVVGADIVLQFLDNFTAPIEEMPGKMIINTHFNEVISATDLSYVDENDLIDLKTLISFDRTMMLPLYHHNDLLEDQAHILFLYNMTNAPWKLYYVISKQELSDKLFFDRLLYSSIMLSTLLLFLVAYYYFSFQYIKPKVIAEQELQLSEKHLNMVAQVANDGIWEWYLDTNQVIFDERYYTMAGYQNNEFPCAFYEWEKRVHPDDIDMANKAMQDYISAEQTKYDVEFRFLCKQGHYQWLRSRGKIFSRDETGKAIHFVGTHSDISKQKQDELNLISAHNNAKKANQSKSQFLANMSHEIRTPINAIMGMTHLLLQTDTDAKQLNYINKIDISSQLLLGIINDILDFSKIEAGQLTIERVDFSFYEVIDKLTALLEFQAHEKGIQLHFHVAQAIPDDLIGDPLRLTQILLNLGNNALKFTDKGGQVVVTVELEEEDDQSGEVLLHFSIRDNGIGMTAEQQQQLFKPFKQVDSTITRHFGGTGLGLAICKNLTEKMHGEIWLESQVTIGTCFHFSLILKKQDNYTPVLAEPETVAQQKEQYADETLKDIKVLLVEDNQVTQEFTRIILEQNNMLVDLAENGQQALDKIAINSYDCILMDCHMPVMDGCTAIKKIRAQESLSQLPVIALTANVMNNEREHIMAMGASGYIAKPIDIDDLLGLIEKWVKPEKKLLQTALTENNRAPEVLQQKQFVQIVGIDTQAGIALSRDNKVLYHNLLQLFYNKYKNRYKQMSATLALNNTMKIKTIAHDIKGAAATIAAVGLQDKAKKLEQSCEKQNKLPISEDSHFTDLSIAVIDELNQILNAIDSYLKS